MEGAKRRLRPVLMTASITALGLDPAVVRLRSRIRNPEAAGDRGDRRVAVVDGCLTLILLPILYRRFGGGAKEAK